MYQKLTTSMSIIQLKSMNPYDMTFKKIFFNKNSTFS